MRTSTSGAALLIVFVLMLVLAALGAALLSQLVGGAKSAASVVDWQKALWVAEGGVNRGIKAIRDDGGAAAQTTSPAANGYCSLAYVEGGYGGSGIGYSGASGSNYDRAAFHGTSWSSSTVYYATLNSVVNANVTIWNFQQAVNLIGSRLRNIEIVCRAIKDKSGGTDPVIQLQYSLNGGGSWSNAGAATGVSATSWLAGSYLYATVPLPANPWQYVMNNNFRIRALRTNAGDRKCYIDWLALRLTTEVDAPTEPWSTGSYASFPLALGTGSIRSILISDESGKIHLNYASQTLLQRLMEYDGIASGTAATLAAAIVSYRGAHWFTTIQELKLVTGMTQAYYDLIDQDVTVYPWVNTLVTMPAGSRSPVNINTAGRNSLRAVIRTGITDIADVDSLADAIITQRATTPFTHMFSTYHTQAATRDNGCLAGFLENQAYLDATQRNQIRDAADGSSYNTTLTGNWTAVAGTGTEFCYYSNAFMVLSQGISGSATRAVAAVYGERYDYTAYSVLTGGTLRPIAFIGQASPRGCWTLPTPIP
ncbi:MAG: hypothetical protein WCP22_03775 [Chlamydiota bacterium]